MGHAYNKIQSFKIKMHACQERELSPLISSDSSAEHVTGQSVHREVGSIVCEQVVAFPQKTRGTKDVWTARERGNGEIVCRDKELRVGTVS